MTRKRKTRYTNTIPAFAPSPAPDFGAMLDEARGMFDTGRDLTLPAVSAGFGAVGVLGLSLCAPDALPQWYALSAIGPALLPPLAKGMMAAVWEVAEVIEWLRGKQQERDMAWQEEVDERAIRAKEVSARYWQTRLDVVKAQTAHTALQLQQQGATQAAINRATIRQTDAERVSAIYARREAWRKRLGDIYAEHTQEKPRKWNGGQPFGQKLLEGDEWEWLLAHEVVFFASTRSKHPQWAYEVVGHTADEAMRWLESKGFFEDVTD